MYNEPAMPDQPGKSGGGDWVGALINAGAQLYDSRQNRKQSQRNTEMTIAGAKSEAELAYQRQLEMWEKQNMYNDPQSQMQRFTAAGLNPNLIYGQGNSGNAASAQMPQYSPARMDYNVAPMQIAPGVTSILPTLMAVGTWMQNMKMSEVDINRKQTDTEKAQQMIDYLMEVNPHLAKQQRYKAYMAPTQNTVLEVGRDSAQLKLYEMEQKFRQDYGEELFQVAPKGGFTPSPGTTKLGGMKRLEYLQKEAETQLKQAQASWTDFDITNPQAIIQMVLQGVMGLAGQTIRATRPKGIPSGIRKGSRPSGVRRIHPSRRVQRSHGAGLYD